LDKSGELVIGITLAIFDLQKNELINEKSIEKEEGSKKRFLEKWYVYK